MKTNYKARACTDGLAATNTKAAGMPESNKVMGTLPPLMVILMKACGMLVRNTGWESSYLQIRVTRMKVCGMMTRDRGRASRYGSMWEVIKACGWRINDMAREDSLRRVRVLRGFGKRTS